MGIRRTKDKIALSFMWPTLTNDVIDYCRTCEICQRRARIICYDKVPIQDSVVSVKPVFSHFYVDINVGGQIFGFPIRKRSRR